MRRGVLLGAVLALAACGSSSPAAPPDAAVPADAAAPPYTITALDGVRITSLGGEPNFQQASAPVDLAGAPFASVTLVLDLATTCYPFETWHDNPPPARQDWPADCDAFDRNFEVALAGAAGAPAIELVRAITPFGGPLHLEVDVTDVANGLPGPHDLTVTIPTWSDAAGQVTGSAGGWNVTAKLVVTPGPAPRRVLAAASLYYDSLTAATLPAPLAFTAPVGATAARLELRATGHGGGAAGADCIGPAEEFCHRTITVRLDGEPLPALDPWREDCDTLCTIAHYGPVDAGFDYCQENPCGALRSVTAPRANWCPGSMTPPFSFDLPALATPGPHTLDWEIGAAVIDGGSWRISATVLAFGD
ncbi:MAG TPA: peptide-N-glycosidase F-related protein [Polyangia bacterium]